MNVVEHRYAWRGVLAPRSATGRKRAVIHHTASADVAPETIHDWHRARGWAGIGYHFVITADGTVHRGRPYWARGAHCEGANEATGIALVGDFTSAPPTSQQVIALRALLAHLAAKEADLKWYRHGDLNPTRCPGTAFPWPLHVASRKPPVPPKAMPLLVRGTRGPAVRVLQRALADRGFAVDVDGVFGARTEAAVERFQKKCKMRVDGIVGRKTWAALGYAFKG